MPSTLAEQFQALWKSNGSSPDVFAFLEQHAHHEPAAKLAVLRCDQQHRWKTAQPLKVEDYLAQLPELSDSACKLELAVGEFQARQNGTTSPSIEEFVSRFADISDTLRKKLSESATSKDAERPPQKVTPTETFDTKEIQQRMGRYRLLRVLGEGAYGTVFLAFDEELERQVAIKVPKSERFQSAEDAELYLAEARTVAGLDHPNIVPVYDMGRGEDGSVYVVSKFIEGCTLGDRIKEGRLPHIEAAKLVAVVAQALHHAHQKRLIHRDIKPANLLIEETSRNPFVADFGLAIKEEDYLKSGNLAGTPAYMSPEQARGEGHRLDGRSDIFSLGIVLYELLTGKRPFRGSSSYELMVQIATVEPESPRELEASLPAELERICLKALAKRVSERYATAAEFADDLLHWNQTSLPEQKERKIVPKGLRSFDAEDADFFLDLLPGPRNREGLPESLSFWKSRFEETDPDRTFAVGLIYGPSGCGKSSLVKAGLLPRLSKNLVAVYIESTPDETEIRIRRGLRKQVPDLPDHLGLVEMFTLLRREPGRKVVIVLDQFEQWLHAHRAEHDTELVNALRQCDGGQLQTVIMVRDDFSMAASRFMRELEARILEGHNFATIDLFDVDHAEKVLTKFGQAFGKLPAQKSKFSDEEKAFLSTVASGLAQDGKVVSVRLALFAEMIKSKPWIPKTLEDVGGTEGIGVTFLEETFSSREANPEHRLHQAAAREVLKSLLPEIGTDIKGHMRSHAELLEVSGYQSQPREFGELLRILDGELRLITPTDPEGFQSHSDNDPHSKYFQLTHDYLVPALREWLTRKQRETRKGRAELRLAGLAAQWSAYPAKRQLPVLWEWVNICLFTDRKKWTLTEQKMMKQAQWRHGIRSGIVLFLLVALTFIGIGLSNAASNRTNAAEASRLVDGLLKAETSQVPSIIHDLKDYRQWANAELQSAFDESDQTSNAKLHSALALLPVNDSVLDYLAERVLDVSPVQFAFVRDMLDDHKQELSERYWPIAIDPSQKASRRFQAACALASFDPERDYWQSAEFTEFVASHLVRVGPAELAPWREALRPVQGRLLAPLTAIYKDRRMGEEIRSFANDSLVDYLSNDPDRLFPLLADATEPQFRVIYEQLSKHRNRAIQLAEAELQIIRPENASEESKEAEAQFRANAAVFLLRIGKPDLVWPLLQHSPDPRIRSYIIHWFGPRGGDPLAILERFHQETDVSIQRVLLLCLGEFDKSLMPDEAMATLTEQLLNVYRTHPDPGLHAATEWLLRQWGQEQRLAIVDQELRQTEAQLQTDDTHRRWYVNSQGQTFVVLNADEFLMGSPESEIVRYPDETQHRKRIGRRIAISAKEITKAQWRKFAEDSAHRLSADDPKLALYSPSDDAPMMAITWYEAAQYCNWLSEQEGIPPDQWCYERNPKGAYAEGMKAKEGFWALRGYRLPTEAEWEFACRAGTATSRYYGLTEALLPEYAWYQAVSQNHSWPVGNLKPNDFGLFDILGNAIEWCQEPYLDYETNDMKAVDDRQETSPVVPTAERVLRGGAFTLQPVAVRTAYRFLHKPNEGIHYFGLRPCRTLEGKFR